MNKSAREMFEELGYKLYEETVIGGILNEF